MSASQSIASLLRKGGAGFNFKMLSGLALAATLYSGVAIAQVAAPDTNPPASTQVQSPAVVPPASDPVTPTGNRVGAGQAPVTEAPATQAQAPAPVAPSAAPATETPVTPAPVSQEPAASSPAVETPAAVAPAGAANTETPAAMPVEQTPAEVAPAEVAAPAPSLLEDPAGAISHMLAAPERRSDLPHDLSPWGMFMAADWVVKAVMLGLAFASLVTWTVWVAKTIELTGARARATSTLKIIRRSRTLEEAVNLAERKGGPAALMLRIASEEVELSDAALEHADGSGVKERVASALARIETAAGRRMSRGTGVLATIGSTSPFVGLFGTVWGIMNSFISISESQTTNLAVVAPGIAEALLATAIGLVAAIPAVVIYNVFARSITGYRHLLADSAAGVERLVSRDLDFRKIPPAGASKPAVSIVAR